MLKKLVIFKIGITLIFILLSCHAQNFTKLETYKNDGEFVIKSITPGENSSEIKTNSKVIITFSNDINSKIDMSELIYVESKGDVIPGDISIISSNQIQFSPYSEWNYSRVYRLTIKKEIHNYQGVSLNHDYHSIFITENRG